jgi:hypothetical protein
MPAPETPEPRLVALFRERQLAREHLSDGYAKGYLDAIELERRLEKAEHAKSIEELHELTGDLVHHDRPATAGARVAVPALALVPAGAVPGELRLSSVFSETRQRGVWTPGRLTHARCLFGAMKLDLREAKLTPGVTELRLAVTFGDLQLIVPPGLEVELAASAAFADISNDASDGSGSGDPSAPRLLVTGKVRFGSVKIRRRRPGESWWDAARRELFGGTGRRPAALPPRGQDDDEP